MHDIQNHCARAFEVNGRSVMVCRSGRRFYALENRCAHQNVPLLGGQIRRGKITCPLHGMRFDLKTGQPSGRLTRNCVLTFPVHIVNGDVLVEVSAPDEWELDADTTPESEIS